LLFIKDKIIYKDVLPFKVDYITGADLFIYSKIYQELKGFDENLFLYYEDDDICRRAKKLEYESIIIDGPKIIHLEGASSKRKGRKIIIQEKSFFYYIKKYYNSTIYLITKGIYILFSLFSFLSPYYSFKEKYLFYQKRNLNCKTY
jgi:GT2 family glycosyltransferase